MNNKVIRLTETDLHNIVKETVNKILNESRYDDDYDEEANNLKLQRKIKMLRKQRKNNNNKTNNKNIQNNKNDDMDIDVDLEALKKRIYSDRAK